MSLHPMLTRVLSDGMVATGVLGAYVFPVGMATNLIRSFPPDIADRLEAALDVCGHVREDGVVCGRKRDDYLHQEPRTRSVFRHEYQPLVAA